MAYLDDFHSAPPGVSLTQEPGKWQWEKPPKFTRPIDAVDFVTAKFKNPDIKENYVKMMMAGISIEEIVNSLSKGGFATGHFSPDVAEIIKTPLGFFLLGIADDYGIPVRLYRAGQSAEKPRDELVDDDTLLDLMRRRNPQLYAIYKEKEIQRMQKDLRPRTGMLEPIPVADDVQAGVIPEGRPPEVVAEGSREVLGMEEELEEMMAEEEEQEVPQEIVEQLEGEQTGGL